MLALVPLWRCARTPYSGHTLSYHHMCRYATAATDATILLISSALLPPIVNLITAFVIPAIRRRIVTPYTQEHHHALLLNGDFNLARATAEVCMLTMHTLTYGAGVPVMYPICACALLLIVVDTKLKLRYVWPIPRRFNSACSQVFLDVVQAMAIVHTAMALWMLSFFRTWGQIVGALHACMQESYDSCFAMCGRFTLLSDHNTDASALRTFSSHEY
jgi:hypothetical protein